MNQKSLITVESVWCAYCGEIRPVRYDYMKGVKHQGNDHDATDVMCDRFHVIATLHHPHALEKFLGAPSPAVSPQNIEEMGAQLLTKYGVSCGVSIQKHGDRLIYGPEFIEALREFASTRGPAVSQPQLRQGLRDSYNAFWRGLTIKGNPERIPNKIWVGYRAGWEDREKLIGEDQPSQLGYEHDAHCNASRSMPKFAEGSGCSCRGRTTLDALRMYACLKCGAEYWKVPSEKPTRCERGECSGQIVANPRRG